MTSARPESLAFFMDSEPSLNTPENSSLARSPKALAQIWVPGASAASAPSVMRVAAG